MTYASERQTARLQVGRLEQRRRQFIILAEADDHGIPITAAAELAGEIRHHLPLLQNVRVLTEETARVLVVDDARPGSPWFGHDLPVTVPHIGTVIHAHVNGIPVG